MSTTKPTDIKPPFDEEKAKLKVKSAENAWNTCNPELFRNTLKILDGEIVLSFSSAEKL
jgi:nuclear transport factor 2 (NTF2) superfamily protein